MTARLYSDFTNYDVRFHKINNFSSQFGLPINDNSSLYRDFYRLKAVNGESETETRQAA